MNDRRKDKQILCSGFSRKMSWTESDLTTKAQVPQREAKPVLEVSVSNEKDRVTLSVTIPATTFSFIQRYLELNGSTLEDYVNETAIEELHNMVDTMPKDEILRCFGLVLWAAPASFPAVQSSLLKRLPQSRTRSCIPDRDFPALASQFCRTCAWGRLL